MSRWIPERGRGPAGGAHAVAMVLAVVLVTLALGSAGSTVANADSYDDQRAAAEANKAKADKAIAALQDDLEGVSKDLTDAVAVLVKIEQKLPEAQLNLAKAQQVLVKATREADLLTARLQAAKDTETAIVTQIDKDAKRSVATEATVGQLARQAYRGDLAATGLDMVVNATSVQDFAEQYGLVTTALRSQTRLLDEIAQSDAENRNSQVRLAAVREKVNELKAEADAKEAVAADARKRAAAETAKITGLIDQQRVKKNFIASKKADLEAEEAKKKAQRNALQKDLKEILRKQAAYDKKHHVKHSTNPGSNAGSNYFSNPTSTNPMYVTSSYGWRLHPVLHYYRMHSGIDLRAYCGTNIYAGRGGTVVWAKYRSGYGNQVMIDHGGSVMTSYNHMQNLTVSAGEKVSRGETVGHSGSEGTSTGCHLHFEVYINGSTVNPAKYL